MDTPEFVRAAGFRLARGANGHALKDYWAIGNRVSGVMNGLVVDIDEDAVVVARRNAKGRCMELVFVGEAIRALRPE